MAASELGKQSISGIDDRKIYADATTRDDLPPETVLAPQLARKLSARQVQMIAIGYSDTDS